ncbi:MAG TPA: DUF6364 family protein [Acidobacteriota bacterium]|nr:DUF6364 family protein [Acidobacteriota bacterium]
MANLTIAIDDDLLEKARSRAASQGTSVNALLRDYLTAYAGAEDERRRAIEGFLRIARQAHTGIEGKRWTREELHER